MKAVAAAAIVSRSRVAELPPPLPEAGRTCPAAAASRRTAVVAASTSFVTSVPGPGSPFSARVQAGFGLPSIEQPNPLGITTSSWSWYWKESSSPRNSEYFWGWL